MTTKAEPKPEFFTRSGAEGVRLLATHRLRLSPGNARGLEPLANGGTSLATVACILIPACLRASLAAQAASFPDADSPDIQKYAIRAKRLSRSSARLVLRHALTWAVGGAEPSGWKFARTDTGKLRIANLEGYDCSLSYTRDYDAVAIGRGVKIGLDAECESALVTSEMMRTFLCRGELAAIRNGRAGDAGDAFVRFWTLKEAILKLHGEGLLEDSRLIDASELRSGSFHCDRLGRGAAVFVARMSELTGGPERGWLSAALAPSTQEARSARLDIYLLNRQFLNAP
jgi:phosphopantetheinyl transferase